jgi:hypothetical protein
MRGSDSILIANASELKQPSFAPFPVLVMVNLKFSICEVRYMGPTIISH